MNREYEKRMHAIKLNGFMEHKYLAFSLGATAILAVLFLFFGYDFISGEPNTGMLGVGALYTMMGLYMFFLLKRVSAEIINQDAISDTSRRLGVPLVFFVLLSNFFGSIGGFFLIAKRKSIEYQLSVFMVLNTVVVMMVSALNFFKPRVAANFYLGMGILAMVVLFYLIVTFIISRHVDDRNINPNLKFLIIPLALTTLTGNLFALILAVTLFKRVYQRNKEISIEWIDIMRRLFRSYTAIIGLFVVVFLLSISFCSFLTFDYSVAVENNYSALFRLPSLQYPFGTDNFGRCVFSRIIFGARISLMVGMTATAIPLFLGGLLGALAGYYQKTIDNVIMRILDIFFAVPSILLAIAIIAAFGASTVTLILAISVYGVPVYARIVRATVLTLSHAEYIEAARACGATDGIIIFKHIIPNSLAPVIVRSTLEIGGAVLSTSALSYLGVGIPSHIPEWGNILRVGSTFLEAYPYLAVFPGLAIILIVLAFNFFGDGLRDALDPKMK